MEPVEPQTTEVIEEKPEPRRTRKNHWVFAGLAGVLVVVMLVVLVVSMQRAKKNATLMLSVNDLTQQKYDLQEREREKNKASQLRDDPLLMRKDNESETESRLQGLMNQIDKKPGSRAESTDDNQARQEEEMIAHVMRRTPPAATGPAPTATYQPAVPARTGSATEGDLRASDDPILIRRNAKRHGLVNGQVLTCAAIQSDGSILTREGKTIPASFRDFCHGYVVTSHKSQGRTHDQVVIAAEQMDAKAAYVACSRGRLQASVFTPDKAHLFQRVEQSGDRLAASDVLNISAASLRPALWRQQERQAWQRLAEQAAWFQAIAVRRQPTPELSAPKLRLPLIEPSLQERKINL